MLHPSPSLPLATQRRPLMSQFVHVTGPLMPINGTRLLVEQGPCRGQNIPKMPCGPFPEDGVHMSGFRMLQGEVRHGCNLPELLRVDTAPSPVMESWSRKVG